MRTSARILIGLGVVFVVFGALAVGDQWRGNSEDGGDAIGGFAFLAISCLVVGVVLNALSKAGESPCEAEDKIPDDDEADAPETPLCPYCMAPTERLQACCDMCGSPLTSQAGIDPVMQFRKMGGTLGRAAANPRSRVILIGMWIFFIVPIVNCIMTLVLMFGGPIEFSGGGGVELVEFGQPSRPASRWTVGGVMSTVLVVGFLLLYTAILIKTTRNYFRKKSELDSTPPYAENIADEV